jgi:hypothetical protein
LHTLFCFGIVTNEEINVTRSSGRAFGFIKVALNVEGVTTEEVCGENAGLRHTVIQLDNVRVFSEAQELVFTSTEEVRVDAVTLTHGEGKDSRHKSKDVERGHDESVFAEERMISIVLTNQMNYERRMEEINCDGCR